MSIGQLLVPDPIEKDLSPWDLYKGVTEDSMFHFSRSQFFHFYFLLASTVPTAIFFFFGKGSKRSSKYQGCKFVQPFFCNFVYFKPIRELICISFTNLWKNMYFPPFFTPFNHFFPPPCYLVIFFPPPPPPPTQYKPLQNISRKSLQSFL